MCLPIAILYEVTAVSESSISVIELRRRLDDDALTIVDVRPLPAYNGWRQGEAARGGHIPGAVAFPSAWLRSVDDAEIERLLDSKGIVASREVVLYGDRAEDLAAVQARLEELGHRGIRSLEQGWAEWAADDTLPVERLPNYDKLVHPEWLRELLAGGRPEAAPAGQFLLFHVNFGVPEEYEENHLPGALYLDTNRLENPEDWNRRTPQELETALTSLGITSRHHRHPLRARHRRPRQREVAGTSGRPDRCHPRGTDPRATRASTTSVCSTAATTPGCKRGNALETTRREPSPIRSFGVQIPQRPQLIVDIDEAKQILADRDGAALVSVRAWNEHIGKISGYNYIVPSGRIAGDVWGNCGTDAYHMQHYRNVDNTMRAYPGDRGELGRGRHHRRQVGRVLLRHRLACERNLVLRLPDGLGANSGV